MIINWYVDDILRKVLSILGVPAIEYDVSSDPVHRTLTSLDSLGSKISIGTEEKSYPDDFVPIEWTILDSWLKDPILIKKAKKKVLGKRQRPRSPEKIEKCEKFSKLDGNYVSPDLKKHQHLDNLDICNETPETVSHPVISYSEEEENCEAVKSTALKNNYYSRKFEEDNER